jgi:hypothetical protein
MDKWEARNVQLAADISFNGKYRREELEEALTLQEEITPLLISILDDIAADSVRFAGRQNNVTIKRTVAQ